MLLITLENCPGCHIFQEAHPELPVIELPRNRLKDDEQTKTIRGVLDKLNLHEFPVILNDNLTANIPLHIVDTRWPAPEKIDN